MAGKIPTGAAAATAAVLLMVLTTVPAADAQSPQATAQPAELEAVTVMAPRITYKRARGYMPVTIVEKSARVTAADLDFTRSTDIYVLEDRVRKAAAQLCEELTREYPSGQPSTDACIRRAVNDTMAQVRETLREARAP